MAEKTAPAPFSTLPLEMKQHIFTYVWKLRDRSATRLVCRGWKNASDPIFWKKIFVSENKAQPEACDMIQKSGLLPLVRDLIIQYHVMELVRKQHEGWFLPLYTRGHLVKLHFERGVGVKLLTSMLKQHPKLQSLAMAAFPLDYIENDESPFPKLADALSHCRELTDFEQMGYNREEFVPCLNALFDLPKLRRVSLGFLYEIFLDTDDSSPSKPPGVLNVEYLQLVRPGPHGLENFAPVYQGLYLDSLVNLGNLKVLKLIDICSGSPILEHLATSLSSLGDHGTSLKSLEVSIDYFSDDIEVSKNALEKTITSFRGLETLIVSTGGLGPINRSCVQHHASSLLNFCDFHQKKFDDIRYSLEDIVSILEACKNLSTLAIHLPPFDVKRPSKEHLRESSQSNLDVELRQYLETIARHKNLRALRVLNHLCPDRKYNEFYQFDEERDGFLDAWGLIYRDFANYVVEYLGRHESSLKLFCISPAHHCRWARCPGTDLDEHHPHYYYKCKWVGGVSDQKRMAAVPFPEARVELPNLELMFRDLTQPDQFKTGPQADT
ncbi:hypothetical protein DM02DRAFT_682225 [Periconia macrospinosa]|uniref:F-box domain-containing protein n=1 Tax=Periconia macrospinosa TaxID=97972 RepID=A0A2V1DMU4_9PLEO|nr:hypothetical protein DM02DRAFT_682225 [Periconia macrospinosa]